MSTEASSPHKGSFPRHVAIIMDGNGRWAEDRKLPRLEGHRVGAQSVHTIVTASREMNLEALTLYAFSSQNWGRPADEVKGLMELLKEYILEQRKEIMENDIKLFAIGDLNRLPAMVRTPLEELMEDSKNHKSMTLTLALSYSGKDSIVNAAKALCEKSVNGDINVQDISQDDFETCLPTHGLPPLDFVIRTSGEIRISNFLLWESAYAELYFSQVMWPDFRRQQLETALQEYQRRKRRFGLVGSQVESGGDLAPKDKNNELKGENSWP